MQLLNAVLEGAGIDTSAGLKIVGGKEERYARILLKFADKQAGTVEEIRTMLAAGDNATAERAAHSLIGSGQKIRRKFRHIKDHPQPGCHRSGIRF